MPEPNTSVVAALARRVLERWRQQGFDTVNRFPSGFCSPWRDDGQAPAGYTIMALESDDAVRAVAQAIESGAAYSFKELGSVSAIDFEDLVVLKDRRVLVVEDRADTRDLLLVILETCGMRVTAVDSGRAALDLLERETFDAIVADIMMPETDGFTMMHELRSRDTEQGRMIPAVALTALDSDEWRRRALESGFQLHLGKPVEVAQLVNAVAVLLTSGRSR